MAGLTLARQLRRAHPSQSILVAERTCRPLPEAAHKVGESSVELGSRHLEDLGLRDYPPEHHPFKFRLRFFPGNVTPPPDARVTNGKADVYLGVDGDSEKPLVGSLITAATKWGQDHTFRFFMPQPWDLKLDRFPTVEIKVPQPPLSSVVSILYIDTDGNTATWASSDYQVDTDSEPGRIKPAFNNTWPTTRAQFNAVTVKFIGGYADRATVPDGIKTLVKMVAAHWHEHREAASDTPGPTVVPLAVESLVWQHKIAEYR